MSALSEMHQQRKERLERMNAPARYFEQIVSLTERVTVLEDENKRLRNIEPKPFKFPVEWGLTKQGAQVLDCLAQSSTGYRSHQVLCEAVGNPGNDELLKTLVCIVRKSVRPFGIEIKTRHGFGYELSQSSIEKIRGLS